MAEVPDFTKVPQAPPKGKEVHPDWIAPTTEERFCGEYAAVRNAVEQGLRPEIKKGMTGDEILDKWCRDRGKDRKEVVLAALRFNLATEAEYAALVAGETAVEAGHHNVTEGLPEEEQKAVAPAHGAAGAYRFAKEPDAFSEPAEVPRKGRTEK
jgi:hypothetical protein